MTSGAARGLAGALVLMAAGLAGCGEEREEPPPLRPLVVKEQVSRVVKVAGKYRVSWAAVLANSNRWHFGENVVMTIEVTDAAGRRLKRADHPLNAVPPAGTLPVTGYEMVDEKPAKVSIAYSQARWKQASRITSAFQPFPVSEVRTRRQGNGSYLVSGRVSSPYRQTASSLVVTALLRNGKGELVDGASTIVGEVGPKSNPRFLLVLDKAPPKVARADVTVQTWGSTARPYEELAMGGTVSLHTVKPKTPPFAEDRGVQRIPGLETARE